VSLYTQWDSHRNLSQLPNFAFSVALALYHLSLSDVTDHTRADDMVSACFCLIFILHCKTPVDICKQFSVV